MSLTNRYLYGDPLPLARKLLLRFSETRLHSTAFSWSFLRAAILWDRWLLKSETLDCELPQETTWDTRILQDCDVSRRILSIDWIRSSARFPGELSSSRMSCVPR